MNNNNNARLPGKSVAGRAVLYVVLLLFSLTTLYPLFWMAYTSFKTNMEISQDTLALPTGLHFENYVEAWKTAQIGQYFFNSVFASAASIVLTIFISALAATVLAKFRFRGRGAIYTSFIVGMLIPLQSLLVPLFILMRSLNLLDSLWSLVLAYTAFGLPMSIFVLESFISNFPDAIIEAALIDSCPPYKIFASILLPMSRPAIATVTIINFLNNWKEFSFALVFLSQESKKTLPLGLYNFLGAETSNYAGLTAALVVASIPTIVLYLIMQEQVINGMTSGAVKG